jgi:hypothetical protein
MTESINKKIQELFENTPENVGVGLGNKIKNGQYTDEVCILFTVQKKLPLNEIPENEILPTSVEIDGVVYKTDVFEVGIINALACPPDSTGGTSYATACTVCNDCYSWYPTNNAGNRNRVRPLQGGLSTTSYNQRASVGTLGFIAQDITTNALVGVSNSHVYVSDSYYTSYRNLNGAINNESSDNTYQFNETNPIISSNETIGQVVRYIPLHSYGSNIQNQVDGALTSVLNGTISAVDSWKQWGLTGVTSAPPFATTAEIDALLTTYVNSEITSTGRSTGPKQGVCGLKILGINNTSLVGGFKNQGVTTFASFNKIIAFTRINSNCIYPIYPGDSGSALIAKINGVSKIIGLCFAGSDFVGLANRIDDVASQLGIKAWDGTTLKYINPATISYLTVPNGSLNNTISCSGQTYWQVGLTNSSYYC